jgi:23S rRNA pseudouridine1911/1915/1917 synthase
MFLGCPIVGDKIYGHRKQSVEIDRHFLHAAKLKITLPGGKQAQTFEAPLPGELVDVLEWLRSVR